MVRCHSMSDVVAPPPRAPRSVRERKHASRERNEHAYERARGSAEREVVKIVAEKYPKVYGELSAAVTGEVGESCHRSIRQSRLRTACCAWYRAKHPKAWNALLDVHIAAVVAELHASGTDVVIKRRRIAR